MLSLDTTRSAAPTVRESMGELTPPRRSARLRRPSSLLPLRAGVGPYLLDKLRTVTR